MHVLSLAFENYRNLEKSVIEPDKGINVIYGNNAQGKTNLLEALWLFCGGHSFRGSKDSEFINFEKPYARLDIKFFSQEREQTAQLVFKGNKREVSINGVKKSSTSALIEKYIAVIFSPEDLTLIKRGPSGRRKFIDSAICREKLRNAVLISKYNQVLNQRNALLKDINKHPELKSTLEIWDDTLCSIGSQIIFYRLAYIEKLTEYAKLYHKGISDEKENIDISYISTCGADFGETKEEIYNKLFKALKNSRKDDFYTGYTNVGPHRDDFDIIINDKKAKNFASQGQQRSAVLSLKLAEAKVLKELTGENPVVLLDDVLSELDTKRQEFLLSKIEEYQVFITCCEFDNKKQSEKAKYFYVSEGRIE